MPKGAVSEVNKSNAGINDEKQKEKKIALS